jgi:hypothetical protein
LLGHLEAMWKISSKYHPGGTLFGIFLRSFCRFLGLNSQSSFNINGSFTQIQKTAREIRSGGRMYTRNNGRMYTRTTCGR